MAPVDDAAVIHERLRTLVAADPRAARQVFCDMLDRGEAAVPAFLSRISVPGEGRLRQMVANAVRLRADKERVVPSLLKWLEVEADEFTRHAIAGALEGVDRASRSSGTQGAEPQLLVDTYRYVAERLCHRVRNSLVGMDPKIASLLRQAEDVPAGPTRDRLAATIGDLREGLRRLSRVVEFDVGDDYFVWRRVPLVDWLKQMHGRYVATYHSANLTISDRLVKAHPVVRATHLLLETLFWNLWTNAGQAAPGSCSIAIDGWCEQGRVEIQVLDSGPGLSSSEASNVFQGVFSTRGAGRGRGLLEARDAASRLQGAIDLVKRGRNEFRFRVVLPEDRP